MSEMEAQSAPVQTTQTQSAPAQSTQESWYGSFGDNDLKGYVELKGFKDPESVVNSYKNLEKLMGVPKDQLLKLPGVDEQDKWGEVYDRLGRPKEATDYKFDSLGEDLDENFVNSMQSAFHTAGLNGEQVEKILSTYKEYAENLESSLDVQRQESLVAQEKALKKEWGAAYEKNLNTAKRAAKAFGLDQEMLGKLEGALGLDGTLMMLEKIGARTLEDNFIQGDGNGSEFGVMSPNAAKSKLEMLKRDRSFQDRLIAGEAKAKAEWNSLHEYAYNFQS